MRDRMLSAKRQTTERVPEERCRLRYRLHDDLLAREQLDRFRETQFPQVVGWSERVHEIQSRLQVVVHLGAGVELHVSACER